MARSASHPTGSSSPRPISPRPISPGWRRKLALAFGLLSASLVAWGLLRLPTETYVLGSFRFEGPPGLVPSEWPQLEETNLVRRKPSFEVGFVPAGSVAPAPEYEELYEREDGELAGHAAHLFRRSAFAPGKGGRDHALIVMLPELELGLVLGYRSHEKDPGASWWDLFTAWRCRRWLQRVLDSAEIRTPEREVLVLQVAPDEGDLHAVQERVRCALAEDPERDVDVRLSAGTYRLAAPLVFDARDGSAQGRVRWESVPPGRAVISGGDLRHDWRVEEDGHWSLGVSGTPLRQLHMDGRTRPPARWPETGWLRVAAAGEDGRTSFTFEPGDLPEDRDVAGSELVFLHDWSSSRVALDRIEGGRLYTRDAIGAWHPFFHITGFEAHPRYALENVRAAWDRPGEWWHDLTAGRVRYLPREGEVPASMEAVLPRLERLVTVVGTPEEPVRNLQFRGLVFRVTRSAQAPRGYAGIQAAFREARDDALEAGPEKEFPVPCAVRVTHAEGVAFELCRFDRLGGSGLWVGRGARETRVRYCRFRNLGGNGLMLGELEEPSPERAFELTADITCENNRIEKCGKLYPGSVGLWIGMARDVRVRNNELRDLPYTGISLGWIWGDRESVSRGHRIERNHIHGVVQELSDGGGIYAIGRHADTYLRENLIHDIAPHPGRAPNNGFFLDQGSTDLVLEGNVVHSVAGSPVRFHMAGANTLRRNTFVTAAGIAPYHYDACAAETMDIEENVELDWEEVDLRGWAPAPAGIQVGIQPHGFEWD